MVTYNVNFGLAGDDAALRLIEDADADAVFLQETTPGWEAAIRRTLSQQYPHMAFVTSGGAGGMAVLSKSPFEVRRQIASPEGWFPAMIVVLDTAIGSVQVLAVHLHPPVSDSGSFVTGYLTTGQARAREMRTFVAALDPTLATLVVGDFNEDARGGTGDVLAERGMTDMLREFDSYQETWKWRTSVGTLRQTLDHVYCDRRVEAIDVRVVEGGESDHWPVVGWFVRAGGTPTD